MFARARRSTASGLLAALVVLTAFCGAASADVTLAGNTLGFVDSPGAATTLTVADNGIAMTVDNSTGTLAPGTGCLTITTHSVSCPYTLASKPSSIQFDLGDLVDGLTVDNSVSAATTTVARNVGDFAAGLGPVIVDASDPYGTVFGGPAGDFLDGYAVSIDGGGGNDKIQVYGGGGNVNGGEGNDHMDASGSTVSVDYFASEGDDVFIGSSGDDVIVFGWGHDLIFGGPGNDRFYDSGDGSEEPHPASDNDSEIWAGPGDDILTDWSPGILEQAHFDGGPGTDVMTYMTQASTTGIHISMDDIADDGAAGETDHVHQSVEDVGTHPSLGYGQMVNDDVLTGSAANNLLNGKYGNDTIDGAAGDDRLVGDNGADTLKGGPGSDSLEGGSGTDTATYSGASLPVTVSLATTAQQDTIGAGTDTLSSIANLIGGDAGDTLTGSANANVITGGPGSDAIDADGGDDTIHANDGAIDTVNCGSGTADTANVDANDNVSGCETVNIL